MGEISYEQFIKNVLSNLEDDVEVWHDKENDHYCVKIIKKPSSFDKSLKQALDFNTKKKSLGKI